MAPIMAKLFIGYWCFVWTTGAAASSSSLVCNSDNVLRALQHRTPDSYSFCSSYISQPPTTTVTVTEKSTYSHTSTIVYTRHPQYLYNLQRQSGSHSPITYSNKNVPTPVPGGAQNYPPYQPGRRDAEPSTLELVARAMTTPPPTTTSSSLPAYLTSYPPSRISSGCTCLSVPYSATLTTTTTTEVDVEASPCTYYTESAVTAVPAICNRIDQVNAPAVQTGVANVTTVSKFTSPDKLSCCTACVNVFNCIWWKFDFAKPAADGTGDPWSPGKCQYAFFTGDTGSNDVAVCPNGQFDLTQGERGGGLQAPGYNQGACGGALGPFQSSQDFDYPDDYNSNNECGN